MCFGNIMHELSETASLLIDGLVKQLLADKVPWNLV